MGHRSKTRRGRLALGIVCAMTVLGVLSPTPARADVWCWLFGSGCDGRSASRDTSSQRDGGAPEIDPGTLGSALALAGGGAAILADRLRRRRR